MHHRYRSFVSLMLAIAWLMHPATLSLAVAQAPPLRGTVSMVVTSLALVVGAEWGKGVLTLADGTQHRFMVKGIELGGMGVEKAMLHGHVYHLTTMADFAGLYAAGELGFTIAGGAGGMAMRNERGVTIYLISVEEGIKTTIGGAGVEIKLQP
jgi:hypothetical protein